VGGKECERVKGFKNSPPSQISPLPRLPSGGKEAERVKGWAERRLKG